jgi:putative transposase
MTLSQKRLAIDPDHERISIVGQCELLGLARSSLYFRACRDTDYNEKLMRLLDEQYMKTPCYGVEKLTAWLRREGHPVNPKRIRRLLRLMGMEAIYPRPKVNLSVPDKAHKIFPYLLRGVPIDRVNQVWSTDITYIRMYHGWVYLVAVMDWHSRYVLSWEVSVTLETAFCITALKSALAQGTPTFFNTDQGSQFTSSDFTDVLLKRGIQVSMDGRGRYLDNIFVERLWRTVKVEEVYLRDYDTVAEAVYYLGRYIDFYNQERLHASLGYRTPAEVHVGAFAPPVALRAPSGAKAPTSVTSPSKNVNIFV